MKPSSRPNLSSRTLARTAKQLVVHDAFETTTWWAGSNVSSLTPMTNVASAPLEGADTTTRGAPASRCRAASMRAVKWPVASTTTSTSRAPQGKRLHIVLRRKHDPMAADHHGVVVGDDRLGIASVHRVPGQQSGKCLRPPEVVDSHHFDVEVVSPRRSEQRPARPTESVDPHPNRHRIPSGST